jgi:hypothetical protein
MAKKKVQVEETPVPAFDVAGLSEEQIVDIICNSLDTLCATLEQRGLDTELITASLMRTFADRMCESNDRATYEEVLQLALEDQWEEVTIH